MKKYALLIGVEKYRDKMISPLRFARADAMALAERLNDLCAFDQVHVLADARGNNEPLLVNIVSSLRDITCELQKEDLFLFFFAGHGVEKDGHGYLLARDSLQAFPEHGSLSLELLRKTFERLTAGRRIILLDACRNSPDVARAEAANFMNDAISRDLVAAVRAESSSGATTALLSACRSGQRAYEWPTKGHGVFTHYLLEGLDGAAWSEKGLDLKMLARFTATNIRTWVEKTLGASAQQELWYEEFGSPNMLMLSEKKGPFGSHQPPSPGNRQPKIKKVAEKNTIKKKIIKKKVAEKVDSPKVPIDPRFTCPACKRPSDADGGSLCKKCGAFVHNACQKCVKVRGYSYRVYACPICSTVVRRKGDRCFLSTAVCETLYLPDDCYELETLRLFRDTYMQETPERRAEVKEYYRIAPQIVQAINARPDSRKIWKDLAEGYILPCVHLADSNNPAGAYHLYRKMIVELQQKYMVTRNFNLEAQTKNS